MLKRIRIQGYKSLHDPSSHGVEVELKPLSVLFGPNAAGKSNFLDALQLLSRIPVSRNLKEAFAPPYRGKPLESFAFGPEGLASLLSKQSVSFSIEADVELSPVVVEAVNRQIREMRKTSADGSTGGATAKTAAQVRERNLRYRIEVEIVPRQGFLRVADEYLAALSTKGEPTRTRRPFLSKVNNRLHLRMEGQSHPTYHESHLDHSVLSLPLYPPHYPHLVAIREEFSRYFFFYFEPRERMRAANPVKEVRHIGLMGEELAAFLNTLKAVDSKQFKGVQKSLGHIIPHVTGIDVEVSALGEVELKILEGNTPIPARVVSEGTLRMLGLLALGAAKERPALIGLEEPENGINPRRIRLIAEYLKARATGGAQMIVTTHSPVLLDQIPTESLFLCQKANGRTRIVPLTEWEPLFRPGIKEILDHEEGQNALPVSQRIQRGDFDV